MRKLVFRVSDQVRHKLAVHLQKMARGFKFWIKKEEGLYYLRSKNKDAADQLRGYPAADLRLCFCICKKAGFLITMWLIIETLGVRL